MATETAAPATIPVVVEPETAPAPVEAPAAAPVEGEAAATTDAPAAAAEGDSSETPASPTHAKKRSPFGDLKNRLFHKVSFRPSPSSLWVHARARSPAWECGPSRVYPALCARVRGVCLADELGSSSLAISLQAAQVWAQLNASRVPRTWMRRSEAREDRFHVQLCTGWLPPTRSITFLRHSPRHKDCTATRWQQL